MKVKIRLDKTSGNGTAPSFVVDSNTVTLELQICRVWETVWGHRTIQPNLDLRTVPRNF